jgi:hypothetical protein
MTLWEFVLEFDDGTVIGQTVHAEGMNEADATAAAVIAVGGSLDLVILRPGKVVPPEIEMKWREVYGDAFPGIVSDAGRLALYARGIIDPSRKVVID